MYNENRFFSRSTSSRVLDDAALRRFAPSVFAESAASTTSDKYQFFPTHEVVAAMRGEGFLPVKASEARARIEEKRGFTRHVIRFRHQDHFEGIKVGDSVPEIVLMNSHDGSSSYQLSAGLFRLVCANGLIVADSTVDTVRCRHSRNMVDDVIEGTYRIIDETPKVFEQVQRFQGIELTGAHQQAFATAALQLRWDQDEQGNSLAPVEASDLLRSRRFDDAKSDLWSVFNRTQENLIKGGLAGRNRSNRRTTTRAVTAPDAETRLNRELWRLMELVAEEAVAA